MKERKRLVIDVSRVVVLNDTAAECLLLRGKPLSVRLYVGGLEEVLLVTDTFTF